jgi:hypothetical protein
MRETPYTPLTSAQGSRPVRRLSPRYPRMMAGLAGLACLLVLLSSVYGSGPRGNSQRLEQRPAPASVTLSSEGSADWAHWALTNAASFNHKAGIPQQISNYTRIGPVNPGRFVSGNRIHLHLDRRHAHRQLRPAPAPGST